MLRTLLLFLSCILTFNAFAGPLRIIIFSAPFGAGHDKAAAAIKSMVVRHYQEQGIEVDPNTDIIVKNTMEFAPKWVGKFATWAFIKLQNNLPAIYSFFFNDYLKKFEGNNLPLESRGALAFHRTLFINKEKMQNFIINEAFKDAEGKPVLPTIVFSTWPGSTEALISIVREQGFTFSNGDGKYHEIKIGHVQTDNGHERYFRLLAEGVDIAFAPSREIYEGLIKSGLSPDRVKLTGMPVPLGPDLPSYEVREAQKKAARTELGLDPEARTVMIEAGNNGGANYVSIIAATMRAMPNEPLNFIAACGKNAEKLALVQAFIKGAKRGTPEFKRLKNEMKDLTHPARLSSFLQRGFSVFKLKPLLTVAEAEAMIEQGIAGRANVIAFGFNDIMEKLRSAADIIATKPGGVSTNEAGVRGFLMAIMLQYASGEALPNGPLFKKLNLATLSEDTTVIGKAIADVLNDKDLRQKMYEAAIEFRKDFNLELILPVIDEAMDKYQRKWIGPDAEEIKLSGGGCAGIFGGV